MALFSGAALFGTGLGPLVSSPIAQHISWRWIFYVQTISCGLSILAVIIFFKETRGSVLLSRRAKLLNAWYERRESVGLVGFDILTEGKSEKQSQRIRWKVKADEERESLTKMIGISVYRPFRGHLLTQRQLYRLILYRLALHRARGLLLLPMGGLQLGSPLFDLLGYTPGIHNEPWIQH